MTPSTPRSRGSRGFATSPWRSSPAGDLGIYAASLPWLALVVGTSPRALLSRAIMPLAFAGLGVLVSSAIASTLDARARLAAGAPSAPTGEHEASEITWSRRILPRTVPWLRSMQRAPVQCVGWEAPAPDDG